VAFNNNARRRPSDPETAVGSAALPGNRRGIRRRGEDGLAGNLDRLEDAGLILTTALPQAHREVLEDLSEEEVRVIVSVATRLRQADQDAGLVARAPFTYWISF
jgi:hypothetical protein